MAGIAGAAWAVWASTGLGGPAAVGVAVAGVIVGAAITARALRLRRSADQDGPSAFRSTWYRLTVLVEVAAIAAGASLLNSDHSAVGYVAPWVAAVVGGHFLVFGRVIARRFYLIGTLLLAGAAGGAVAVAAGADVDAGRATAALVAAVVLLGSGLLSTIRGAR
ncbi:MAG: hypothetical protein M3Y91_17975 [Actinomycetota bacterium]|nr:hypothetical protein [Actinomycetota bacterium]